MEINWVKMLICPLKDCICIHHRLLHCIKEGNNDEAKSILQDIENPYNLVDSFGLTLLHYSTEFGNKTITQYLVDGGCNINAQNTSGVTALMLAIKNKNVTTVDILLRNNADIYVTDQHGESSLDLAFRCRLRTPVLSKEKSNQMVEMLFDKVNEDFSSDNHKITQFLLQVNDFVKLAAVVYGNEELGRFILKNGYNVDYREPESSKTALHCAVAYGRIHNCKILLEHGANVNAIDNFKSSPLLRYTCNLECLDENSTILKMLLKRADNVTLSSGQNKFGALEVLLIYGKKETVRTVLQSDIDLDVYLKRDRHILQLVIQNKNIDVINLLDELNIKFDVNRVDSIGGTALMSAAFSGCLKNVEFLLKYGADINKTTSTGLTALLIVAKYCWPRTPEHYKDIVKITELLLQRGADAQCIFEKSGQSFIDSLSIRKETLLTKAIVAHLAMLGALDKSLLTEFTRKRIECYPWYENYFCFCTQQLEQMKKLEVYGTVTLFKLLAECDDKILTYARNKELISAFESIMEGESNMESYYSNTLRNRIENSRHKVEWQQKAASTFESLSGLCTNAYHNVVYQILNCLNLQDLQNLFKAGNIAITMEL